MVPGAGADEVLVPMTQMRKGIAAQMTRALQAPHAYVEMEVDATRLVNLRERIKKDYQAKEGISISYVPFVVKASAEALKRNPTFNAHWTDDGLLAKRRINIGLLEGETVRAGDWVLIHVGFAMSKVDEREAAEALKGTALYAGRDALPALGDDEFYHADLIGLTVYDTGGAPVGKVTAVHNHGAGDLLEVTRPGPKGAALLPFTRAIVPTVDLASGRIVADIPEGLIE